jgi:hypothetical protein
MIVTQWFDGDIKPEHIGPYEMFIQDEETDSFQYWDGMFWGLLAIRSELAIPADILGNGCFQDFKWRGLAENPNEL